MADGEFLPGKRKDLARPFGGEGEGKTGARRGKWEEGGEGCYHCSPVFASGILLQAAFFF